MKINFENATEVTEREKNLVLLSEELLYTIRHLRFYTIYWQEHYGATNRANMKRWEERADQLLKQIKEGEPIISERTINIQDKRSTKAEF